MTVFFTSCTENKNTSTNTDSDSKKTVTHINIIKNDSLDKVNNKSIIASGNDVTKAYINLQDSSFLLTADMNKNHRFFGYQNPDIKSERVILFSIFTNDIENNPFGCKLGAYYDTNGLENITIKYSETNGDFIKVVAIDKSNMRITFFIEKKWIIIE